MVLIRRSQQKGYAYFGFFYFRANGAPVESVRLLCIIRSACFFEYAPISSLLMTTVTAPSVMTVAK